MARLHDDSYSELAAWAESDQATAAVLKGRVVRGTAQTRALVHTMLEEVTEDDPAGRELVRRTAGRPALDPADAGAGPSPLWQARAPRSLDAAMRAQARAEGRTFASVLRDAAREYLVTHRAG
jgi:hypothetical protein